MAQCINWVWIKSDPWVLIKGDPSSGRLNLPDSLMWKTAVQDSSMRFSGVFWDFEKIQKCPKSGPSWLFFVILGQIWTALQVGWCPTKAP